MKSLIDDGGSGPAGGSGPYKVLISGWFISNFQENLKVGFMRSPGLQIPTIARKVILLFKPISLSCQFNRSYPWELKRTVCFFFEIENKPLCYP